MYNSDICQIFNNQEQVSDKNTVPKENRILIDWLSFTSKKHSVADILQLLGMDSSYFEVFPGSKGFRQRMYYGGISIHHQPYQIQYNHCDEWVWLEMSGQGCRTFETHGCADFEKFFSLARSDPENIHITRVDIAFDDMSGVLDIDTICEETKLENFTSRLQTYQSIFSNKGNSVYFGGRYSNIMIRIYDKAKERGYDDEDLHWIRCELQLKDENAMSFSRRIDGEDLQDIYLGLLKNYLIYREPVLTDSNKRRWPVREWWDEFLNDAVRVSLLEKPGVSYNLSKCQKYVLEQPGQSIKTLIKIFGLEEFGKMILDLPPSKNPKYSELLKEAKDLKSFGCERRRIQHLIDKIGEEDVEFLVDVRRSLIDFKNKFNVIPSKADKETKKLYRDISSIVERISEYTAPVDELESDDDLMRHVDAVRRMDELHQEVLQRRKEYALGINGLLNKN